MLSNAIGGLFGNSGSSDKSDKVHYTYRYRVVTYQLLFEGEPEPFTLIPSAINKIIITKEFDEAFHPTLELFTMLPPKVHSKIIKNKKTVSVRLRLQSVAYDDGQMVAAEDVINDTFALITDDEDDFKDEPLYNDAVKQDGGTGDPNEHKGVFNMADYSAEYIVSLWKVENIQALTGVVNDVMKDCTISTVMTDVFSKSGIKKILMSPLDNEKSYDQLTIPPMNLMSVPQYLEKHFSTYYCGTNMFFDFRCLYILNKNGGCSAYEKGEYKRTFLIVKKPSQADSKSVGTTESAKKKEYYINIEPDNASPKSSSAVNDAISGNNVTIIDADTNETTIVEGAGDQRGSGNHKVVSDNYSNEFNKSTMLSDINEKNLRYDIVTYDYNDFAMTPNKEFCILFEDPARSTNNGFYRLISSIIIFSKKGPEMDITGKHEFAFKSGINTGEGQEDINAENSSTMPQSEVSQSENGVESPTPKTENTGGNAVTTAASTNNIAKRNDLEYDSYGNVKGVEIPEYNIITSDDDGVVVAAKKEAQLAYLPSETPKPKI